MFSDYQRFTAAVINYRGRTEYPGDSKSLPPTDNG